MNDRFDRLFTGWFIFCAFMALAWLGFIVWAITRVVVHFT